MASSILQNASKKNDFNLSYKEPKKKKKNKGGILGGVGYTVGKTVTGALGVVENTVDVVIGTTADLLGQEEFAKRVHTNDYTDTWNYSLDKAYNPSGAMKVVGDVAGGLGQSATYLGASLIPYVGPQLSTALMAGSGVGSGIQGAVEKTGNLGAKEYLYGGLSGATELALEKGLGAAGKLIGNTAAKTTAKAGAKSFTKSAAKRTAKEATRKGFIRTTLSGASGEAMEEAISATLDPFYQKITGVDKNAKLNLNEVLYSGFIGALSGGALTAGTTGLQNAGNLNRGTRIVDNGNAEYMINTAKHISKALDLQGDQTKVNNKTVRERFSVPLQQLDNAIKAYEALDDKTGTKAKLYLGEIQQSTAFLEVMSKASPATAVYKAMLDKNPEEATRFAQTVTAITGKTVTAEDIRNNTKMFGDIGAMDMLGVIKFAGEVVGDITASTEAIIRESEMVNEAVERSNVGTQSAETVAQTATQAPETASAPTVAQGTETAAPTVAPTMQKSVNAQVNPSAFPNTSVNTAENAQISTEASAVAENANAQATTAETQNAGMESMRTEQGTAQNKKASANTEVKRDVQRTEEKKSLKDQIKDHQDELNQMDVVSEVDVDSMADMSKTEKTAYVMGLIGKRLKNGGIERSDIGFIELGEKQIRKSYKYLSTDAEYMALAAVPDVLENGEVITERENHKERGHSTVTIAAPVTINGKRGNLAVVLKKTDGLKYKVHRILSPDGSVFTLENAEAEPTPIGVPTQGTSEEGPTISSASDNSIADSSGTVNPSEQKTSEKSTTKRAISLEEAEALRKESTEALLAEENAKAEKQAETKKKADAESKAKAKAEADAKEEAEAERARLGEAFAKAEREAFDAIDDFFHLPANVRYNITRMYMDMAGVKDVTKETKKALASIMAVNPDLHIYTSDKLSDHGAYWYENGQRCIVINKNDGAVAKTILHEVTHALAKGSPTAFRRLAKFVLNNTSAEEQQKVYNAYLIRHLADLGLADEITTLEEANAIFDTLTKDVQNDFVYLVGEEITARAVGEALGSKGFLQKHGKEYRGTIARCIAHLRELGAKIFNRSEADKQIREIEKMFSEAVFKNKEDAARFAKEVDAEIKRAVDPRTLTEEDARTLLKNAFQKKYRDGSYIPIRINTPSALIEAAQSIGKTIDDYPIIINVEKSRQMMSSQREWSLEGKHGTAHEFSVDDVISLVKAMDNPKRIVYQSSDERYVEIVEFETKAKKKAVAVLEIGEKKNPEYLNDYEGGFYQVLVTAFEPDEGYIDTLLNKKGNVEIYPRKKKGASQRGSGNRVPSHLNESPFANSITDSSEKVNTPSKISRSIDVDSPSAKLDRAYLEAVESGDMEAVQEMVDKTAKAKGYAIKSYHGTLAKDFTEFKKSFIGSRFNYDDKGFFFIDRKSIAEDYATSEYDRNMKGRVLEVYLRVKKPLLVDKAFCLREGLGNPFRDDDAIGVWDAYLEFFKDEAAARKADGIIIDDGMSKMTVVFDGEQIKSADPVTYDDNGNVIPLSQRFDSKKTDIRRSLDISDRIISTHDERTKLEKVKEAYNTVKSRSFKENKAVAKDKAHDASVQLQVLFTNDKAGIEDHLVRVGGLDRNEVEAATHMVTVASRKGQAAITGKQTNIKGEVIGDSLQDILKEAHVDENRKDANAYLVHLVNLDRAPRGKEVFEGLTVEESEREIARLEKLHPEFKHLSQRLQEFNRNLMQLEVDAGLLSPEQAEAFLKYNPHYITLHPLSEAEFNKRSKDRQDRTFKVKDFSKQAKGGGQYYEDVIDSYMDRIVSVTKNAYINVMANAVARAEDGDNVILLREDGDTDAEAEVLDVFDLDEYKHKSEIADNGIVFYVDGKKHAMKVSKNIMEGFKSLHKARSYYDDTVVGKANFSAMRIFKGLVTTWNPFFLLRNPTRDIQDGLINTRFGAEKFIPAINRAREEMFSNGALWQEYIANGGIDTSIFEYKMGNDANKMGLKQAKGNALQKYATKFENMQLIIEQMPRFAEYILSREAGNDVQTALWHSADVTVNFSRGGMVTKALNKYVIPFLNPAVQGMSRNVRLIRDAIKSKEAMARLAITAAILGILPMVLSNLLYEDDEEYENLSDNLKANYYLFAFGEGDNKKFIRLPKGRVVSALASFTNVVQTGADVEEAVKNTIEQTSAFGSIRPFFSPVLDVYNNKTWYGGEIEGRQFESVAPAQRYDESTSEIAKYIGKAINYSPKKIHYLLDQYSGAIGDFLLPITSDAKKASTTETLFSSLITDPVYSNKLSSEFYDLYDEVNWADDSLDNLTIKKHLDSVKTKVGDLNDEIDDIYADDSLSDDEKASQVRALRILVNRTYKTALEDYKTLQSVSAEVATAYETTFTVESVTSDNYKALGLEKDDIGDYAIVYQNGDQYYATQTRGSEEDAEDYAESTTKLAAYADMCLVAYGAESAIEAYSKSFYEKAKIANSLGAEYETLYEIYSATRYMSGEKKKKAVNEYLKGLPLSANVKNFIRYICGDTTTDVKKSAAKAIKNANVDEETKIDWLEKLQTKSSTLGGGLKSSGLGGKGIK